MLFVLCPIFWPVAGFIAGASVLLIAVIQFWAGIIPGVSTVTQFVAVTFLLLAF